MKVKIPSNYDPIMKNYAVPAGQSEAVWNGLFKGEVTADDGNHTVHYTDNPAWVFYDLQTNFDLIPKVEHKKNFYF